MRIIQVTDEDCRGLLDQLELEKYRREGDDGDAETVINVHRHFHYVVTKWLQRHGAKAEQ